ncbi:MAG: SRPBCC domain-containing protein, partial [Anaerolineales bacterium]
MPDSIRLSTLLPATPRRVYQAWLSSQAHTAFTGAEAEVEARVGGRHRAWDDYITGRILELDANRRIVMTWRTTEFPSGSPDSRVEVFLEPEKGGTRLILLHSQIPPGDGPKYDEGWRDNYFGPMSAYFKKKPKPGRRKPVRRRVAGGRQARSGAGTKRRAKSRHKADKRRR